MSEDFKIPNPLVILFDWFKKRDMERLYDHQSVWDRDSENKDVDAAVHMVTDRRYRSCLDVGTGLGHYAERLAPHCDSIVATDISEKAIARATERLSSHANITFKAANLRTMPVEKLFDLVVAGDVLYYLGDTRFPKEFAGVLEHLAKLVAPGGRFLMTNFIAPWNSEKRLGAYVDDLVACGLVVEKDEIFSHADKSWRITVMRRPIATNS